MTIVVSNNSGQFDDFRFQHLYLLLFTNSCSMSIKVTLKTNFCVVIIRFNDFHFEKCTTTEYTCFTVGTVRSDTSRY